MEETIQNNKSHHNFKIFYVFLLIIVAVVAFLLGDIKHSTGDTSNDSDTISTYSIKYTSIDFDDDCTYVFFDIKNENNLTMYAGDFAVKIDDLPIKADYILTGYTNTIPIYGGNLDVYNQTIKISFEKKKSELDSPITFYYKGVKLELGKAIIFEE